MEKLPDFSRSFFTFRIDTQNKPPKTVSHNPPFSLNNARIPIDCRCQVEEKASGRTQSFVQGVNCKAERVGVDRDIWLMPNADFVPIFSDDNYLAIKTYARKGVSVDLYPPGSGTQSDRQTGSITDFFDNVRIDVVECEGELLSSAEAVVGAVLNNDPLVARTQFDTERYQAILEYPVKSINANERDMIYQTDTGPVLLPDFMAAPEQQLERMELAFSAFNCPHWIELLVRVPTEIADGVEVYHYDRSVRFDARNELIRMGRR